MLNCDAADAASPFNILMVRPRRRPFDTTNAACPCGIVIGVKLPAASRERTSSSGLQRPQLPRDRCGDVLLCFGIFGVRRHGRDQGKEAMLPLGLPTYW